MNGYFVMAFIFGGMAIIVGWILGACWLVVEYKWWKKTIGISMLVIILIAMFIFGAMSINGMIPKEIFL
jgi:hypothetical protein